jgi:hypothetical protein
MGWQISVGREVPAAWPKIAWCLIEKWVTELTATTRMDQKQELAKTRTNNQREGCDAWERHGLAKSRGNGAMARVGGQEARLKRFKKRRSRDGARMYEMKSWMQGGDHNGESGWRSVW